MFKKYTLNAWSALVLANILRIYRISAKERLVSDLIDLFEYFYLNLLVFIIVNRTLDADFPFFNYYCQKPQYIFDSFIIYLIFVNCKFQQFHSNSNL